MMKIGLEVHIQLNTKTKLFCGCSTKAVEPNSKTCPVCLGHPGSKPVLNKTAVEFAARLAYALNSKINKTSFFSRKTYFYPDLSKNFQITQYEVPLAEGGFIEIDGKRINIKRLHIEEDPASLTHEGNHSLIDYNRSGIPLVELVTEPDMTSPDEAREFLNKLFGILAYLDIFDESTCIVKADANISIEQTNFERVEIKNITGFKEIERALTYEAQRQKEAYKNKEPIVQETRGWNADKGFTYSMRAKEAEEDYGYIAEPDIPALTVDEKWQNEIKNSVPELPAQKAERWIEQLHIDAADSRIIAADPEIAELFEKTRSKVSPVLAARWTRREVFRVLNLEKKSLKESPITADSFAELLELIEKNVITNRIGQELIEKLAKDAFSPKEYVKTKGLGAVSDEESLMMLCKDAIKNNPKAVEDFKKGEQKSFEFLIGKVMAATKGKAVPAVIRKLMEEALK